MCWCCGGGMGRLGRGRACGDGLMAVHGLPCQTCLAPPPSALLHSEAPPRAPPLPVEAQHGGSGGLPRRQDRVQLQQAPVHQLRKGPARRAAGMAASGWLPSWTDQAALPRPNAEPPNNHVHVHKRCAPEGVDVRQRPGRDRRHHIRHQLLALWRCRPRSALLPAAAGRRCRCRCRRALWRSSLQLRRRRSGGNEHERGQRVGGAGGAVGQAGQDAVPQQARARAQQYKRDGILVLPDVGQLSTVQHTQHRFKRCGWWGDRHRDAVGPLGRRPQVPAQRRPALGSSSSSASRAGWVCRCEPARLAPQLLTGLRLVSRDQRAQHTQRLPQPNLQQ